MVHQLKLHSFQKIYTSTTVFDTFPLYKSDKWYLPRFPCHFILLKKSLKAIKPREQTEIQVPIEPKW